MQLKDKLLEMFPEAGCELNYSNLFELTIAVLLSAQTFDKRVNMVTDTLFSKYKTPLEILNAPDLEDIIKPLGLYKNKAKNIKLLCRGIVEEKFEINNDFISLTKLPGIGRKSANVILAEYFKIPCIPVDTHVYRVSIRLNLAEKGASFLNVEKALMEKLPEEDWIIFHHLFIFLGRYVCKSKNPICKKCLLKEYCNY